MAKAKAEITISRIVDIASVTRYYKMTTATAPPMPSTNPPDGWVATEPTYESGSLNTLFFIDVTEFTNGTHSFSEISKSSSYEAAKLAYATALDAAKTATNYINADENGLVIGVMTDETLGRNIKIDRDSVDIRLNANTILSSYGEDAISLGENSKDAAINLCAGVATITAVNDAMHDYNNLFIRMNTSRLSIDIGNDYLSIGNGGRNYISVQDFTTDNTKAVNMVSDKINIFSKEIVMSCNPDAYPNPSSTALNGVNVYGNMYICNGKLEVFSGSVNAAGLSLTLRNPCPWIGGMTSYNCIVAFPHDTGNYHPVIRQNTSYGDVFNIGGGSFSEGDQRFGIYAYKKGRTENGYDYGLWMNSANGSLHHEGHGLLTSDYVQVGGTTYGSGSIELYSSGWAYIDLHCNGYTTDYSVRLAATEHGCLDVFGPGTSPIRVRGEGNEASIRYIGGGYDWAVGPGVATSNCAIFGWYNANYGYIMSLENHGHLNIGNTLRVGSNMGGANNPGIWLGTGAYQPYIYNSQNAGEIWIQVWLNGGWKWFPVGAMLNKSTSDVRLKDNVQDSTVDALSVINSMKIRSYIRNDTGLYYKIGVVADELEELDDLLTDGGGSTEDGHPYYKSVNVLQLSSYAIKGIQELSEKVDALTDFINQLKSL